MEDAELKGLQIIARLLEPLTSKWDDVRLSVLGVPRGESARLRQRIDEWAGYEVSRLQLFEYSSEQAEVALRLKCATVVVMPSMVEGFGLVAWEALGHSVPTIVAKDSGAGLLIGPIAPQWVLDTSGPYDIDALWFQAIDDILADPARAFQLAGEVANKLAAAHTWEAAAAHFGTAVVNV